MTRWVEDKRWSDKFLPEIKAILGVHLIGEPPIEEDQERNTDLIVLKMEAVRIGCRVRRYKFYLKYPDEFTIRAGRPSGYKTELTKIIEGWGDYFFYGFCDKSEGGLIRWILCDLKVFRLWLNRSLMENNGKFPGTLKENFDGSSSFMAFSLKNISGNFIIGENEPR